MFGSVIQAGGGKGGGSGSIVEDYVTTNLLGNQLISGNAIWTTGLSFAVSACVFVVDGQLYTSAAETVTLTTADGTHPRIDVIAVNIDGTADVVTGTAAADPVKPEVDPNTQVEVTFVLVAASASAPSDVSNEDIYLENTEWTSADSGATIDPADTTDPNNGSTDILFDTAVNGNYLTLTDSVEHSPTEFATLFFYIKNISASTSNRNRLRIAWYNSTSGDRVSGWIDLRNGQYGFDAANLGAYQLIQIPMVDFAMNGVFFDQLRFQVEASGSNSLDFYLDDIKLQKGVSNPVVGNYAELDVHNVWTKAQGSGITTLTDAATIAWDMGVGNVFRVTLDGNRTMAAPTNVRPGYTYILFVQQDGTTGSRTITWNAVFKWAGDTAPTLSTGTSAIDVITFVADWDGNLHGSLGIADSQ